ncbi:sugar kinase [Lactococcus allomyrinae]|uniref:Sugar kinase n=1 Tax=Lactococcus allomyrinae TaxID=2419773 RepID=A0A387BEK2_9LACT|nr:sugar kinase [Lactococcus allomyrinae]AYG00684.1 sugar kinase [Lactococcus allomyrinae]
MTEFLTIGEPLVVLVAQEIDLPLEQVQHFTKYVAGAELNVAIGLARLGHQALYLSEVGDDPFGNFIIDEADKAGIDTSLLTKTLSAATGFYIKQNVSHGDPQVAYFRKNSAASQLTAFDIDSVSTDRIKIAHLSGIFPALSKTALETFKTLNTKLNADHVLTVFDTNLRPALWQDEEQMIQTINCLAKESQIILPGINEGEILTGSRSPEQIADFYLSQSELTHTVIVKLGAEGAFVKTKSSEPFMVRGFKVKKIVDTVGAGDGFAVGLESALLEGKSLHEAVVRACAVGALAVQNQGDNDGYPTPDQLREFYQRNGVL